MRVPQAQLSEYCQIGGDHLIAEKIVFEHWWNSHRMGHPAPATITLEEKQAALNGWLARAMVQTV